LDCDDLRVLPAVIASPTRVRVAKERIDIEQIASVFD
jgi:hypothetical protein